MKKENFHLSIVVNATAKEALESISHVSEWWAKKFEGRAEKLNDIFIVRFGETFVTFKIVEVIPNKKIVWEVIDCYLHWLQNKKEWNGTKIQWEVSTTNNLTTIDFTHIGLVPAIECFNDCVTGWTGHVTKSLFKLITEHKGMPE